jgi:hypothetical protein
MPKMANFRIFEPHEIWAIFFSSILSGGQLLSARWISHQKNASRMHFDAILNKS